MANRSDNFTAADGASSLFGRTPSDGGSAWLIYNGTWGIIGNEAYPSAINVAGISPGASRAHAVLESSSSVGEITHTLSGTIDVALIMRFTDINNFMFIYITTSAIQLYSVVGGTVSNIANASGLGTIIVGDVIRWDVTAANLHTVTKNGGGTVLSFPSSANATGTKVGMRGYVTGSRYPDFSYVDKGAPSGTTLTAPNSTQNNTSASGSISSTITLAGANATQNNLSASGSITSNSITPTDFASGRFFQRVGTSKNIVFSGAYVAAGGNSVWIEVRLQDQVTVKQALTILSSATVGSGSYTGTLNVPQGGKSEKYTYVAQIRDASNNVLATSAPTSNLWRVGAAFGCIGSSSGEKWFNSDGGTGFTANAGVNQYTLGNVFADFTADGPIQLLANTLNDLLNVPVCMVNSSAAGSKLATGWQSGGSNYISFTNDINAVGGTLEAVWSVVGVNDAYDGSIVSQAAHEANYRALISNTRTFTGQPTLKFFITGAQSHNGSDDTKAGWVRAAELNVADDANNYYAVASQDLTRTGDQLHLTAASYTIQVGERMVLTANAVYGSSNYYRGPHIGTVNASGTTILINVVNNAAATNLSVTSNHGFEATDGSGALSIANGAVSVTSPTQLTATAGRTIVPPVTLKYAWKAQALPNGFNGVRDNTTQALPMESEADGITSSNELTAPNSTQNNLSSSGAIIATRTLSAATSTQNNLSTSGAIASSGFLGGANATQNNLSSSGAITQTYTLSASNSVQNNLSQSGSVAPVTVTLTATNSVQNNLSDSGIIGQSVLLTAEDSTQNNLSGYPTDIVYGTVYWHIAKARKSISWS